MWMLAVKTQPPIPSRGQRCPATSQRGQTAPGTVRVPSMF
jgi:hypothetical protein